jgi:hypothetical protein
VLLILEKVRYLMKFSLEAVANSGILLPVQKSIAPHQHQEMILKADLARISPLILVWASLQRNKVLGPEQEAPTVQLLEK